MSRSKITGVAITLALGAFVALPGSSQAQVTGCANQTTIDLSPVAVVNIWTCDLATAPECGDEVLTLPSNPLVRADVRLCELG